MLCIRAQRATNTNLIKYRWLLSPLLFVGVARRRSHEICTGVCVCVACFKLHTDIYVSRSHNIYMVYVVVIVPGSA